MKDAGLALSTIKSEAIILSTKKKYEIPRLLLKGKDIKFKPQIKYLGVVLQGSLSFKAHLEATTNRSAKTVLALARLMPNVGSPG